MNFIKCSPFMFSSQQNAATFSSRNGLSLLLSSIVSLWHFYQALFNCLPNLVCQSSRSGRPGWPHPGVDTWLNALMAQYWPVFQCQDSNLCSEVWRVGTSRSQRLEVRIGAMATLDHYRMKSREQKPITMEHRVVTEKRDMDPTHIHQGASSDRNDFQIPALFPWGLALLHFCLYRKHPLPCVGFSTWLNKSDPYLLPYQSLWWWPPQHLSHKPFLFHPYHPHHPGPSCVPLGFYAGAKPVSSLTLGKPPSLASRCISLQSSSEIIPVLPNNWPWLPTCSRSLSISPWHSRTHMICSYCLSNLSLLSAISDPNYNRTVLALGLGVLIPWSPEALAPALHSIYWAMFLRSSQAAQNNSPLS